MTMKIEVFIPEDAIRTGYAGEYLADAMAAIGYSRGVSLAMPEPRREDTNVAGAVDRHGRPFTADRQEMRDGLVSAVKDAVSNVSDVSEKATDETAPEVHIVRERGKPAPGKARRTKAEIEEDEAADAADQREHVLRNGENVSDEEKAAALKMAEQWEETADVEPKAAISTGEERVSPEDEAASEQDAADEAADPANATGPEPTRDDVRKVMEAFMARSDYNTLVAAMTEILAAQFPGGKVTKLSDIPEDAAAFKLVIDALNAKMGA